MRPLEQTCFQLLIDTCINNVLSEGVKKADCVSEKIGEGRACVGATGCGGGQSS